MKKIFFSVYILLVILIILIIGIIWSTDTFLEVFIEETDYIAENHFEITTVGMFLRELQNEEKQEWHTYIERKKRTYDNRIALKNINELDLLNDEVSKLQKGQIVLTDNDIYYAFGKIPKTNQILVLGPFGTSHVDDSYLEVIFILIISLLLAVPALIWSFILWRDFRKIETVTNEFGKGKLSARIPFSTISSLKKVSNSFNNMAEKIESLINSHKDLTNAVSHEIRTPLARLNFGLELLKLASTQETSEQQIAKLESDVNEIKELVDEMLFYAKFDRELELVNPDKHKIAPFISAIISTENDCYTKGVISFLSRERNGLEVRFDKKYMKWAVRNLVKNAMVYSEQKVHVTFELKQNTCILHVDDDGHGIPKSEQENIFKPFTRLDSSRTRDTGGYGLGLSIVQKIAKWHGGKVSVTASKLGGARFSLKWPKSV